MGYAEAKALYEWAMSEQHRPNLSREYWETLVELTKNARELMKFM